MPRCLDPQNWFPVWLDSDTDKPESERPMFMCRYLNSREELRMSELAEKLNTAGSTAERLDALFDCLEIGIHGWKHMHDRDGRPIPFSKSQMADFLSTGEAMELADKMMRGLAPGGAERKKSESPSPSVSENSAKHAAAESAGSGQTRPESSPDSSVPVAAGMAALSATDGDGSS